MVFYLDRYKARIEKEYRMEVVTPMFLGGADPKEPEIRAASIKGLLRFWWRAIYGVENIGEMQKMENHLFGSTDKKSKFSVHTYDHQIDIKDKPESSQKVNIQLGRKSLKISMIDYLAYGVCSGGKYSHKHISPGSKFDIKIIADSTENLDIVNNCMQILFQYGGLGAKNRNGFGNCTCSHFNEEKIEGSGVLRDYTAFSNKTRLFRFQQQENWQNVLTEIGKTYYEARKQIKPTSKRGFLGKPIVQANINERHAKPYFLHVNKLGSNKFQGQILFLPYNYYETEKKDEYMATCEKVNEYLSKKCREVL